MCCSAEIGLRVLKFGDFWAETCQSAAARGACRWQSLRRFLPDAPALGVEHQRPCCVKTSGDFLALSEVAAFIDSYRQYLAVALAGIFGQPATDIGRQGQPFDPACLAAHDDRARPPVDILQHELCDLAAPQAEPDRQGQNGQIAATDGSIGIAGREKARDLIGFKPLGQPGQPAAGTFGTAPTSDLSVMPSR